ncbi:MAG: LytTR family DNA-binding domain-containing protein [Bacteroidota bacterium]
MFPITSQHKQASGQPGLFLLPTSDGIEIIACESVIRIEAISNYCRLYFQDGKTLVVAKLLAHFEALLSQKGFVRTHRSHLINMRYIRKCLMPNSDSMTLQNQEVILISKRKRKATKITLYSWFNQQHSA